MSYSFPHIGASGLEYWNSPAGELARYVDSSQIGKGLVITGLNSIGTVDNSSLVDQPN